MRPARSRPSALAACGSGGSSSWRLLHHRLGGNEGGTLLGAYAAFPDYLDPALSHTLEGWTATYDTYIPLLTYAHESGAGRRQGDPRPRDRAPQGVSDGGKTYN